MAKIETITSRDNRRLISARRVRDGKSSGEIFIEGRRLVEEALRSDLVIEGAFLAEGFDCPEIVDALLNSAGSVFELSERLFRTIADTEQPQGIAVIAERPTSTLPCIELTLASDGLPVVVFLSKITDPSNLGAVLRSVEAAGAAGVIISTNSADAFSPKASRAAMGANFRLPIVERMNMQTALEWANENGLSPVAADASADKNYTETDWKERRLVCFGSEAHGFATNELELIGDGVRIPMENNVESLNLAVSAGIILFEAKRQFSDLAAH